MKSCANQVWIVENKIVTCRGIHGHQILKFLLLNVFYNIIDLVGYSESFQICLPGVFHPFFFKEGDGRVGNYRYLKCDPGFFKARLALQDLFDKSTTYFTYSEEYDIDCFHNEAVFV